ncbi:MAG: veratrol--corrinoid protein metyltransferase [Clostridiales bacterium]|jgi:uroporphyrinogen-III decarboxylase|nr:veratrol--corrinoid protein metyltransferase [Clostridiales bacterium]
MITEKENWKRMMKGEMPEFLPKYDMLNWSVMSSAFMRERKPGVGGVDMFGVEFVPTQEGAAMPKPGKFLLDDIRKWRDVIKVPDISNIDWEALAKKDLEKKDVENNPVILGTGGGLFQQLMSFMGFTEGCCALIEEPEEVNALLDYLNSFYLEVAKHTIRHYKPDGYYMLDDNATALNPFISRKMHRELFMPYYKTHADLARENNLYIQMHDCGRCEDFIDDWLELGVVSWDPAQSMNDLLGIKARYGKKIVICGGWDYSGPISWLSTDDNLLKDALAEYVDTYAPGGGFAFMATVMGKPDDEDYKRKMKLIDDFYLDYARDYYKTH